MDLDIRVIDILTPELFKKLHDFSEKNWGPHYDTPEQLGLRYFATPNILVVGSYKNKVAGLVEIFIREFEFLDKRVKMGGLGGMVVDKKLRRRGFATQILEKAMETMKIKNVDISMLCTDIEKLSALYRKVGFVPLGRAYYFINAKGEEDVDWSGMIAPVKSQKIFEEILNSKEKLNVGVSNF